MMSLRVISSSAIVLVVMAPDVFCSGKLCSIVQIVGLRMQVREIAECDPKGRYHYQIMKRFGACWDSITFEASKTKINPHEIEKPTLDYWFVPVLAIAQPTQEEAPYGVRRGERQGVDPAEPKPDCKQEALTPLP